MAQTPKELVRIKLPVKDRLLLIQIATGEESLSLVVDRLIHEVYPDIDTEREQFHENVEERRSRLEAVLGKAKKK